MFILIILFGLIALGGLFTALLGSGSYRKGGIGALVLGLIVGGVFAIFSSSYQQEAGTAYVIKSFTGTVVGSTGDAGWHWKSPFDSTIEFDVRNQQALFAAAATAQNGEQENHGAEITVADENGVTSNVDVAVNYSIDPGKVIDIYKQYQSADNYTNRYITQSIRSAVREAANGFSTLDLNTKRSDFENAIRAAINKKWASQDYLSIDNVSLQDVRIPDSVKQSYADAQNAQIKVTTEQNNLKAAQVAAQQQVVQAKATAEANRALEKSLTPQVLKQHTLDTMAKLAASGNLVITDGTGSTLLNVNRK